MNINKLNSYWDNYGHKDRFSNEYSKEVCKSVRSYRLNLPIS